MLVRRQTLLCFFTEVCNDFQIDMKEDWEDVTVITIDDKMEALK